MHQSEPANVGRAFVPAPRVRESTEKVRVAIPRHSEHTEPVIELIREGDVVRAIEVICSCGQRIRLLCDYGQQPTG